MNEKARPFAVVAAFSGLLWLPLLLLELVAPYSAGQIAVTPVLRTAFGWAALVCFAIAGIVAAVSGLVAGWIAGREALRVDPLAPPLTGFAIAAIATIVTLRVHAPLAGFVTSRALPPELALAGSLLVGCGLAIGAVALTAALVPALRVRFAMAGWCVVAVVVLPRPSNRVGSPAELLLIGMNACAILLLVWRHAVAWTQPRWLALIRLAIAVTAILGPLAVVVAADPTFRPKDESATVPRDPRRDNVLVIVIDTLRADHTTLGGYALDTTPNMRRLAGGRATYFSEAWSAAPHTIAAVYSLFTARLSTAELVAVDSWSMAGTFQAAGYATGAITANGLIDGELFRRGFDEFRALGGHHYFEKSFLLFDLLSGGDAWTAYRWMGALRIHKETAPVIAGMADDWIARHRGRAFFLYVHFMDPHWPYYDRDFGLIPNDVRLVADPYSHVDLLRLSDGMPSNARFRGTSQLRELVGRYDEEIRLVDESVGGIVEKLEALGLDSSTFVIVVGDHGEEFFEHNGFGHGHDVYEELIHVPLLLLWTPRGRIRVWRRSR